jgi:protein SCO1/2
MLNKSLFAVLAAPLVMLAACQPAVQTPPLAGAALGGPFELTNEKGVRVKDSAFAGSYRLVYFGYTFCPDVCPVDLQKLMQGLKSLEKSDPAKAAKIQPIFITVDPARDNPAALTQFVQAFHPRLTGLTGSEAELAAVRKAYGVYSALGEKRADGGYTVDHSRSAILYGPKGEPIANIAQDGAPDTIAADIGRWVK